MRSGPCGRASDAPSLGPPPDRPAGTAPVMILNWNGWDDVLECLASVRQADDVSPVWLVDNGSDSDRASEALEAFPGLRVVRHRENHGFAGGYNRALRLASGEGYPYAYLLNNDCRALPGFFHHAQRAIAEDPGLAAVGSCILYADAPEYALFDGHYHVHGSSVFAPFDFREVPDVNGAGMLIRLSALEDCGYLDERFFCYGEETEWCWRARDKGWRIGVAGMSKLLHRREGSDTNDNALYYRSRNRFLLLERLHGVRRWWWTARYVHDAGRAVRREHGAGERGRAEAIAAGARDALRGRFGRRGGRGHAHAARLLLDLLGRLGH